MQLPNLSALCTIGMNSQDPSEMMHGNEQQVWEILGLEEEEAAMGSQGRARAGRAQERESKKFRREQNTPEARAKRAREESAIKEAQRARIADEQAKRDKAIQAHKDSPLMRKNKDQLDALLDDDDDDDGPAAAAPAAAAPAAAAPAAAAPVAEEEEEPVGARWADPNPRYVLRL